ncbi:SoxR reducing system RseC family protein [Mycoplasmopsis primatum]|uniref:SoxR reducing system RseC family protein n=1 Tax=Mycoplasmopsis primatum TaxID=55604 RepID=UPI00068B194A|nr:SoxR reducing system RseC family protein [Mycoplasmopsis primatum]
MSICKKCNNDNSEESKFCSQCGINLSSESTSAEQPQQEVNLNESNYIAIVGLVLAFFIPILGLIFSCIGLSISKQTKGGAGGGQATAGIFISILMIIITFFLIIAIRSAAK